MTPPEYSPALSGPRPWWRRGNLCLGLILTVGSAVIGLLAPVLAPGDPAAMGELSERLLAPSSAHLLGTDLLGRDLLVRLYL